jgi:hypothetical protein
MLLFLEYFAMTKYTPLRDFLDHQVKSEIRLGFAEVEKILGAPLPRSAFEHQAWWANNPEGHSHCRSWHDAGWRTEGLNLTGRSIVFTKVSKSSTTTPALSAAIRPLDPWGALAATVTIYDDAALTQPSGEIWDAEAGA